MDKKKESELYLSVLIGAVIYVAIKSYIASIEVKRSKEKMKVS